MLGIKLTNNTTHLLISIGSWDLQTTIPSISKYTKGHSAGINSKGNHNTIKYNFKNMTAWHIPGPPSTPKID